VYYLAMRGKVLTLLLALGALQRCADDGPSAPSSASTTDSAASAGSTLSGRVVNAVTGAPVGGASIEVAGGGSISADSGGVFRLERTAGANVRLTVEASGYWPRSTGMRPASQSLPPVTVSLMPDGDDFDLSFYDHVFRDLGEDGTHPWTTEPIFEIWEGVYECTAFVDSAACEELKALPARAPAMFFETMRGVIGADARKYTDGHVLGSNISTRSHPAGTVLPQSRYIEPGKVTIAYVSTRDNFSWALWRYNNSGPMIGAHIHINTRHLGRRGVYSHELAHALGFAHPLGLDSVPLNSIMRRGHGDEPTRFDVLHARILYGRPAGSRTPDVDPFTYLLGSHHDAETGAGETTRAAP
jgi:Carboxypeptidase regulatory-like domain